MTLTKLEQYRSDYEDLCTRQKGLYDTAASVVEGKERGWKDDEETRFDQITKDKKALLRKIEIEEEMERNHAETILNSRAPQAPAIHTEKRVFDISKAIRAAVSQKWDNAGLERENMQEKARQSGTTFAENRIIIDPNERADAYSVAGTAGDGGNLIGTDYRPDKLIDTLWNASVVGMLPVERNTGMKGNESMAAVTSKVTATMVGETDDIGDSEKITFSLKTATPKQMITHGAFSRQLDLTSAPNIRNIMNNQILKAISYKLDDMFMEGSGTAPVPYGILGLATGGAAGQTKTIALGTNGAALTYANLVQMKTELAKKNIAGNLYYLTNGQVTGTLMTTLKDTANTASGYILGENQNTLLRFPIIESQTVPYDLTKGSASGVCSAIVLGKFDETAIYQWGNIAVEFDPFTAADTSLIKVRSYSFWDILHKRPENYVIIKDVLTTA